jgi:PHD/YefM family antitoxin component YafN of YafNO toxin-antitoxin module
VRSVTIAEVGRSLAEILDAALREPVRIQHGSQELVVVSAKAFEDAQEHLRRERVDALLTAMEACSREAAENGFTEEMLPDMLRN